MPRVASTALSGHVPRLVTLVQAFSLYGATKPLVSPYHIRQEQSDGVDLVPPTGNRRQGVAPLLFRHQ